MPAAMTCDGAATLPQLTWSGAPERTKSFALVVTDPDAPKGTFVHWVISGIPANVTSIRQQAAQDQPGLTKRELEILQLVAEGHSNGELARMLWVTEQTVKFHLSNIYRKLDVANRTEASRWAQLHGLLAEPMAATA